MLPSKIHPAAKVQRGASGSRSPTGPRSTSGSRSPTSPTDNGGWDALWTVHETEEEAEAENEAARVMNWNELWRNHHHHHDDHQYFQPISEQHSADLSLVRPEDIPLPPSSPSHSSSLNLWSTRSSLDSYELRTMDQVGQQQCDSPVGLPDDSPSLNGVRDIGSRLTAQALNQSSDDDIQSSVPTPSRTVNQLPSILVSDVEDPPTTTDFVPMLAPSPSRGREALEEIMLALGRPLPAAPNMSGSSSDQGRTAKLSSIRTSIPEPLSSFTTSPLSSLSSPPPDGSSSPMHSSEPDDHWLFGGSSSSPIRPTVDRFNPR